MKKHFVGKLSSSSNSNFRKKKKILREKEIKKYKWKKDNIFSDPTTVMVTDVK